ncbi:MAG: hypothetical protein IKF97_04835 [Clostridia bacterium]|nr:hypothetical protein [Clostridia bacterium]
MEDEKRVMELNQKDFAIVINALMNMRRNMIQEQKETDLVDKVIKLSIKAPTKKGRFKKKRKELYETR